MARGPPARGNFAGGPLNARGEGVLFPPYISRVEGFKIQLPLHKIQKKREERGVGEEENSGEALSD